MSKASKGKVYDGARLDEGCEVYVRLADGRRYPLDARRDIRNHSPDGFEWGYGGSGPAQLALAILADAVGPEDPPRSCPFCGSGMDGWRCSADPEACGFDGAVTGEKHAYLFVHPGGYQDFKDEVVSKLPRQGFALAGDYVLAWRDERVRSKEVGK